MTTAIIDRNGNLPKTTQSIKTIFANLGLISAGSLLFVIGMNAIMIPRNFLSGGLTGIALLLNYRFSFVDIGMVYFILNIPLIVLGWLHISRRFILYSLFGVVIFSATASFVRPPVIQVQDPMLAALLAGVICGVGSGLILRSIGSVGGFDILAVYLNKNFGYRMGSISFVINTAVIVVGAHLHDLNVALYSIVLLFTSGRVIDAVVSGFNTRRSVMIVSNNAERIANDIMHRLNRGVTFLDGEGGYSRQKKKIILTVSPLTELPKMKELVLHSDPEAFIVVHNTMEVFGKRHSAPKVY